MWLLVTLKKAVSGINPKANTRMTLVKTIASLVYTKQSASESDDKFFERFKSILNTVELAGGKNVFCPVDLMEKAVRLLTRKQSKRKRKR